MQSVKRPWRAQIQEFFYHEEIPYGLALCRILLSLSMLGMMVPRWYWCREIFSTDGAPSQLSVGYGYGLFLPEFSGPVVVGLFTLMIIALVTSALGWLTRASLLVAFSLTWYFAMLDSATTMAKFTVIACHVFVLLALSECGSLWSVDAWLRGRRQRNAFPHQPAVNYQKFPAWPRRLIQLHVGLVYFGAAVTKLQTPAFLTGDQLHYWMITHLNFPHYLGEFLSLFPAMLVAMSYISLIWEVLFVFLAWKSSWRHIMIPVGILFHVMTVWTLGLLVFPLVMFATYLAFLDEDDVRQMAATWRRWMRRWEGLRTVAQTVSTKISAWTPLADRTATANWSLAIGTTLAITCAIEVEYWLDPYGQRRPEGPYALTPLEPEVVAQLLAPPTQIREVDKFFAVDTGTLLVAGILVDRRSEFKTGDQIITQCTLTPPHEDMWVECNIVDVDNRTIQQFGSVATRDQFRANFNYLVPENLPPGEYSIVIHTGKQEVTRKKIQIVGTADHQVATR